METTGDERIFADLLQMLETQKKKLKKCRIHKGYKREVSYIALLRYFYAACHDYLFIP